MFTRADIAIWNLSKQHIWILKWFDRSGKIIIPVEVLHFKAKQEKESGFRVWLFTKSRFVQSNQLSQILIP
jgi:hypothetical protein